MGEFRHLNNVAAGTHGLDLLVPALKTENPLGLSSIALPLYQCDSVPKDDVEGSGTTRLQYAEVKLKPAEADSAESDQWLRDGWLYIFVDGFLWHEYQVDAQLKAFRDVDLRFVQGQHRRAASGCPAHKIVLPTQLSGQDTSIQIAYSEEQWSWARICAMGGMNPDDPRLQHRVLAGESLSQISDQYPFIESYQALADLNGIDIDSTLLPGQQLTIREPDETIGDSDAQRDKRMGPALSDQAQLAGDYSTVLVQDPLGIVDAYNTGLTMLLMNLKQMLGEMGGSLIPEGQTVGTPTQPMPYPYLLSKETQYQPPPLPVDQPAWQQRDIVNLTRIAQYSYSTYLDEESRACMTAESIRKTGESITDAQERLEEIRESLDNTAKRLHREDIRRWLHVDERAAIRKDYRTIQEHYINYLCGDLEAYANSDYQLDLETVLEDFTWLDSDQYHKLWSRVADIENHLVIDPNTFDQQYDHKGDVEAEREAFQSTLDKGRDLVEDIHCGSHPMSSWLFPMESEVDIYSDIAPTLNTNDSVTGPDFRLSDFQRAVANEPDKTESVGGEKNGFDFINRFAKVVSALADSYKDRPRTKTSIQMLFRLIKGTGLPNIEGLHLVSRGESLDGKTPLGKYRVEKFNRISTEQLIRNERKFLTKESAAAQKTRGWYNRITQVLDNEGRVVASSDIGLLRPWQGVNPNIQAQTDAGLLFESHGKTGNGEIIIRASMDVWVVPHNDRFSETYRQASELQGGKLYSQTMAQLPKIMLLMEAIALKEVMHTAKSENYLASSAKLTGQFANTLGAIVDVLDAWHGPKDAFIHKLANNTKYKSASYMAKLIKLPASGIYVPLIRWIGPVGNTIGAVFTAVESYKLFQQHDNDAALLTAVAAVLGLTGAIVGLAGGGMATTLGATASTLIPIAGWIIFGLSLITLWIVNTWLRDTPAETWAEHSPFSDDPDHRLDHDEQNTILKSLHALQNLTMQPSAEVSKSLTNGMHRITVVINHPAFELSQSTLEFEAAAKSINLVATWGHSTTIKSPDWRVVNPASVTNRVNAKSVTNTTLIYEFPEIPDESSQYHASIKETQWRLRFRHILPDGLSLPINDSAFDASDDDQTGWAQTTWTTR